MFPGLSAVWNTRAEDIVRSHAEYVISGGCIARANAPIKKVCYSSIVLSDDNSLMPKHALLFEVRESRNRPQLGRHSSMSVLGAGTWPRCGRRTERRGAKTYSYSHSWYRRLQCLRNFQQLLTLW